MVEIINKFAANFAVLEVQRAMKEKLKAAGITDLKIIFTGPFDYTVEGSDKEKAEQILKS